MSGHLQDQPWLTDPATLAVMEALEVAGGPDCARFVGGCVRNALIGQPVDDIDIATTLRPEETQEAIVAAGLKPVPTGLAHGTVTAVSRKRPFEITTLRRDVETDGRNATVAFTDDWSEDAARRDFRLNALYADRHGRVFDPTGHGMADAQAGRIIFVGDAETRIREDYLRILRLFRFLAWYGRDAPDADALTACATLSGGMSRLSAERVSKELLKLLAAPDPRSAMQWMTQTGVLRQILPEAVNTALFHAMVRLTPDPLLRLSGLLPEDVDRVGEVARRLRLSNPQRDRLVGAVPGQPPVLTNLSETEARAALYRLGHVRFEDQLIRAQGMTADSGESVAHLRALAADWSIPSLPVGGHDVVRLGGTAGRETGRLLKAFETSWIADDFPQVGHDQRLLALIKDPA